MMEVYVNHVNLFLESFCRFKDVQVGLVRNDSLGFRKLV